jgi:hypothetical protein
MTRRLGLASLVVVVFAFGGAAAGPARPLEPLRIVVSMAWPQASKQAEHKARPIVAAVAQASATEASPAPRPVRLPRFLSERWLFQRPPPVTL